MGIRNFWLSAAVVPVFLAASCVGEGRGTGSLALTLSVEGTGEMSDGAAVPAEILPDVFVVSLAMPEVVPAETETEDEGGHSHSHSAGFTAPDVFVSLHEDHEEDGHGGDHEAAIVVNLLGHPFDTGGELDLTAISDVAIGEYTGLLIGLLPSHGDSQNEPETEIEDLALYFEGTADCGDPVTVIVEVDEEIHDLAALEADAHLEAHGETAEIHLVLDTGGLFSGIDVCALEESPADTVVISHESANADALEAFLDNLSAAFSAQAHSH